MYFVNLTPHTINEVATGLSLSSAGIARVAISETVADTIDGIAITVPSYGDVTGIPSASDGTIYIVSLMVAQALPDRIDLVSPGDLVRDDSGRPIGCRGFRRVSAGDGGDND